ncbi:hypothetical protein LCGC14_1428590 [marine sediment metagenome]|uniref:Uncharacterized protein n=1 Tax=marine sediment metagenome TaxID=412755 RepID=A0A0F9JPA3_9ZZZZ
MINFFICVVLSIMISFGMAIALVEKGDRYPIRKPKLILRKLIRKFSRKFDKVLYCTTCLSFYFCLFSDIVICIIAYQFGFFYFFWPFSGFAAVGFSWFVIEFLNALDQNKEE